MTLSETVRELLATAQPLTVPKPDRPDKSTKKTTKSSAKDTITSEGSSAFTTGSNEPQRITFEERRVKEKTRPEVTLTLHEPPPAALPAPAVYPDIQIPPEHFNTVQMLMGPGTEARPGTIPWTAVVNCLVAMGFSYSTGHGSARIFEPSEALMASQVSDVVNFLPPSRCCPLC